MPMTSIDRPAPTQRQLDDIAWQFLRSEFTGAIYAHWSIDRRLDVFLLHRGFRKLHDDGSAYGALMERVMANLGAAARLGMLPPPHTGVVS